MKQGIISQIAFAAALAAAAWMLSAGTGVRNIQLGSGQAVPAAAAVTQNNLGVGYMNQYLYKEAADCFQKALDENAGFNLARINLGIALYYGQSLDQSLMDLEEALKREPGNPYAHYALGLVLKTQGESEAAAEHFKSVTEIDPADSVALYNLGVLYARLRKNAEAEAAFRRALELEPMNTSVMYNLGTLLLKTGRTEEANAILDKFRPLQQKGNVRADLALGTQYGEMGKYALAVDYLPASSPVEVVKQPAPAEAPFTDATAQSGLPRIRSASLSGTAGPAAFSASEWSTEFLRTELLPRLGGSIVLADLNDDQKVDALVTEFIPESNQWQTFLLLNDGRGRFTEAGSSSGIVNSGSQVSAAVGDYDNDGLPDVCLAGLGGGTLFRNLGGGRFESTTAKAGLAGSGLSISATFVDYDHDGDLDLYICRYADVSGRPAGERLSFPGSFPVASNRMFRNNGNGTFTDHTDALGVGTTRHHSIGMVPSDIDNDRDIDLVVVSQDGPPQIFLNQRNDRFSEQPAGSLPGGDGAFHSLCIADLNQDGNMDFFLAGSAGQPNALWFNRGNGTFSPDSRSPELLRTNSGANRFGLGAFDYDNDGDLDLYVWTGDPSASGGLWQNLGGGRYAYAGRLGATGGSAAAAADLDNDGRSDLLCLDAAGQPRVFRNESRTDNRWIGVSLEGGRSNKEGFGAKVEVRAGLLYQKLEVQGHNGYLSQNPAVLWLGLGEAAAADTVTVRWPSGILQSELNVPAGKITRLVELDRKGTSCPLLYTWNGKRFKFVTDFLGGCAIGYLVGPSQYNTPDTDEYVLIGGDELVARDGRYLVQMANHLEEIIMFDQAQLLVLDHPPGTEVYPNERLQEAPPFPDFKLCTARNPQLPRSAVDEHGNDLLPSLARRDRACASGFRPLPFKGYAETHELILDLGILSGSRKAVLLMDGWIDYADSTSNLAASQAGVAMVPPYLQVRDAAGEWRTVIPEMGFPAGLPRTMLVDLSGRFLSADRHVRIVTNMRIYWDRIRVDASENETVRVTRLDPASADLHFLGYPAYYTPDGKQPWIYDYSRIQPTELWQTQAGAYTRYGDVRELLLARDDMYAITRHGDEISLTFDARSVPDLPAGWKRDFLLYADGYGKDMDLNSLYPEVVGPLPFHAMTRFPYPSSEKYPDDAPHRRYQRLYNTRVYPVSGAPTSDPDAGRP